MEQRNKNKPDAAFYLFLKLAIACAAVWFIYQQLLRKEHLGDVLSAMSDYLSNPAGFILLALVFLLMIFNWAIEALKWKLMMRKIETVSFQLSLKAVCSGLAVSFFTPNRVGEFAGRVFHLPPGKRIEASLITVVESISQLVITLAAGSISLLFYLAFFGKINGFELAAISLLASAFSICCLLAYLTLPRWNKLNKPAKWLMKWRKYIEVIRDYGWTELATVLVLALLRFIVFNSQFYFLLILFKVEIAYPVSMMLGALVFLVMTLIPTIALTELGVKSAVAVFFYRQIADQPAAISEAAAALWLINLVIPAVAGIFFVFGFRFEKKQA